MEYGVRTEIELPWPCALMRTREALVQHGFEVVSEMATENPRTAIFALGHPACEVVVYEDACGGVTVVAMGSGEAGERLDAVLDWLRPRAAAASSS